MTWPFRLLLYSVLCFAISGCSTDLSAVSGQLRERAKSVADAKLAHDLWNLCEAQSISAIRRRFGQSDTRARAYNSLCNGLDNQATLAILHPPVE